MPTKDIEAVALYDYDAITEEEIDLNQGDKLIILNMDDIEWYLVKRLPTKEDIMEGIGEEEGYVPKSFVKLLKAEDQLQAPEAKQNQHSTALKRNASTETLAASSFKNVPTGFRPSSVSQYLASGKGRLSDQIFPQVSADGLSFTDFHIDHKTGKIMANDTSCNLAFSVIAAKSVPFPSTDFKVKGRYINVCVFDKMKIIGNVFMVPVIFDNQTPSKWKCTLKNSSLFSRNEPNAGFLRCNELGHGINLLFDLVIVMSRTQEEKYIETSCGWGLLPLYQFNGKLIDSKQHEIKLFGGTPFEPASPLNSTDQTKSSLLAWSQERSPRLIVNCWQFSQRLIKQLSTLPRTLIAPLTSIEVLSTMRKILYDATMHKKEKPCLDPICLPSVSLMLRISNCPDVLLGFSKFWDEKLKLLTREERKSKQLLKKHFFEALANFWPMLCAVNIPKFQPGNDSASSDRFLMVSKYVSDGSTMSFSQNSSQLAFTAFDSSECVLSLTNSGV